MANSKPNKTVRGSLPCGNPKRYTTADVVQMQKGGPRYSSSAVDAKDQPEGENYIQTLLKHQTRTEITFKEQFSQHRRFVASSSHAPTVNQLDGLHTTEEHVKSNDFDSRLDYLKSCGLTEKEIDFKLKRDLLKQQNSSDDKSQGYGADPITDQLLEDEINRKIAEKEDALNVPDRFNGGLEISRHALVLEKSILAKQNKESTLPDCLFKQKKLDTANPDDPINQIDDILSDIEPKPVRESRRDRRRKRKLEDKLLKQQEYLGVASNPVLKREFMKSVGAEEPQTLTSSNVVNINRDNLSDDCERDNQMTKSTGECSTKILDKDKNEGVSHTNLPVGCDQPIEDVPGESPRKKKISPNRGLFTMSTFGSDIHLLTDKDIQENRLSFQEILSMDKFKNYDKGDPNKTVFVKNLPNNPSEADLISMFGRFQRDSGPEISFRLLQGRMRGQAFVTFPDCATAEEAISNLNGYKLRGKPVILSFGKRQDSRHNEGEDSQR